MALSTGVAWPSPALADRPAAAVIAPVPAAGGGVAVVALGSAADAAWPLAQAVYAIPSLRPALIDDTHARVLCGERAPSDAPAEVRDLAETVTALRGDDAPSRTLLGDVARRFGLRAIVVVSDAEPPSARVFLPEAAAFDAATYAPDHLVTDVVSSPRQGRPSWSQAVVSLVRVYGSSARTVAPSTAAPAPFRSTPPATRERPGVFTPPASGRMFYESGWFWAALGAAAFAGAAAFLATRDSHANAIHLQVLVPR